MEGKVRIGKGKYFATMGQLWGIGISTNSKLQIISERGLYEQDSEVSLEYILTKCDVEDAIMAAYELFNHSEIAVPFLTLLFIDLGKHLESTGSFEMVEAFWWGVGNIDGLCCRPMIPEDDEAAANTAMAAIWLHNACRYRTDFWQVIEFVKAAIDADNRMNRKNIDGEEYVQLVFWMVLTGRADGDMLEGMLEELKNNL